MMQKHVVGNKAVAALLAVNFAVSMAACGGNGTQGQPSGAGSASTAGESRVSKATAAFFDSKTEIPAEQAFGTKSVWFDKGSGVDIDDESTVDWESRVSKATAAFFDSKTEIPAEQAFGTKSVWFDKGSGVDIDDESTVDYIYVFDGKGSVTAYQTGYYPSTDNGAVTTTYGDLLGLSEDELIQLAKDRDKDCFDNARENYLSTSAKFFADKAEQDTSKAEEITKKGEEFQKTLSKTEYEEPAAKPFYLKANSSEEMLSAEQDTSKAEEITKKGEEFQKTLSKTEYEEPAAKPFYLKANSSEEMLSLQIRRFNEQYADYYLEDSSNAGTFETVNKDLELKPIDAVQLDGMRLQGYSRIVTSVGPNNKGFTGMEQ